MLATVIGLEEIMNIHTKRRKKRKNFTQKTITDFRVLYLIEKPLLLLYYRLRIDGAR